MNPTEKRFWSHPSVEPLATIGDPVDVIVDRAGEICVKAIEQGWAGPPFDTFELANILGLSVIPCESIRDARLIPISRNKFRIEYNPNQPQSRIRFSIAHEIAHTLFHDCREHVRNRTAQHHMLADDWQLEMLCNVGAAELLMPTGSFPEIGEAEFSIDRLLNLREQFEVSTEAVLHRFLKLAHIPCSIFASSRRNGLDELTIDYVRSTNGWNLPFGSGYTVPGTSALNECHAIGYTAKGDESWGAALDEIHVEAVAVPPYPGTDSPRVVGLMSPMRPKEMSFPTIRYLVGDATSPRRGGHRIIAHIVNDATPRWGGGFARVVGRRWREAQRDFVDWTDQDRRRLTLGNYHAFDIEDGLSVFHMIAQHGYGPSDRPRVRYRSLEACLAELAKLAESRSATVHMPRIGCGQAGGNWAVVSELVDSVLCRSGVEVTVYDPPSERSGWETPDRQRTLFGALDAD